MTEEHQYQTESESLSFPEDTLVGILPDPDAAMAVVRGLVERGIAEGDISVLCGEAGARRLDPEGDRHGLLGRLQRLVQHFGDQERPHVERQAKELQAGAFLVAVPCPEDEREELTRLFTQHGGYFVNHYASWSVTRMEE